MCVCLCFISEITDPVLVKFDKGDESDFDQYQLTVLLCLVLYGTVMVIFCGDGSWFLFQLGGLGSQDPSLITVYQILLQLPT